jgi:two-component system cell cycle sensor histidine kinase/response regulator CckA
MSVRHVDGPVLPNSRLARYLLPALFAILTAAIGNVTWRFYATQKELTQRGIQSQLLTVADAKVREISEWRKGRLGEARAIMADTFTVAAFERVIAGKAAPSERAAAVDYLRSICADMSYAGAILADPEGRPVLWEGRRFGDLDHLKSLMRSVIQAGDVVERDFDATDLPHAPHLGLNIPLRAGPGRPAFGGLLLSMDPQDYLYPLQTWPVPSRTAEVFMVRREGDSVLHLSPLRYHSDAALRMRVPLASGVPAVMAVQGRQGNVEAVDYRGVPVLAALRPVPGTAWYLIAKIDVEEVSEPIRRRSILLAVTAASLILAAGAVLMILWRRVQLNLYRQRYESEIAHRALMEQYNNLSRYANDVILLLDANGTIITANDRAADVYGYSLGQLLGVNIQQLCAPSSRAASGTEWQLAKERGSLIFETVHQRRDGSEFAVEVSTRSIVVEGKTLQQGILRDISDHKQAERELFESEARFRQLVESAPYGILVVDRELILYANAEAVRMFGAARPGDLLGHSLLERAGPEEHESMLRRAQEVLSGSPSPMIERRYLRLNGEEFWAAVSVAEIEYNGRPAGLLFYRDITAAKRVGEEHTRLEEQLRQAQKMESVGRLAGGVAHDFNNYLTVINGYCEMLLGGPDAGPEIRESLEEIRAAGARAASITQQLLAFSRKQIATPRVLSLNQVVTDSGQLLRRLIGEDIEIVIRLHAQPGNVMADPSQLGQVLMNLAINARDAMPNGGQIVIETGQREIDQAEASASALHPGRYALLSVTDAGAGMSPDVQERIFEPFFTTKGAGSGTGLGLSTAYGIVHQSGGWIDVRSSPGAGSRFEVWLPLTDAVAVDAVPPPPAADSARGVETLLIVEDQGDVRRLALSILRGNGYRLLEAENAEQALQLSAGYAGGIELLITDVIMPGLNGRQLADRLAKERPGLKVLYTSGYAADVIALQGSLEPGMAYLPKPFGAAQLAAKVREVLGAGRGPSTVLVIDDDSAVRGFLRQILAGAGYVVVEAGDGKSGMSKIGPQAVDLVITDLVMPEQEGLETLQRLRIERPNLPVIAISGAFGGSYLKTARRFGASATLVKPIDPEALLRAVREALASSGCGCRGNCGDA